MDVGTINEIAYIIGGLDEEEKLKFIDKYQDKIFEDVYLYLMTTFDNQEILKDYIEKIDDDKLYKMITNSLKIGISSPTDVVNEIMTNIFFMISKKENKEDRNILLKKVFTCDVRYLKQLLGEDKFYTYCDYNLSELLGIVVDKNNDEEILEVIALLSNELTEENVAELYCCLEDDNKRLTLIESHIFDDRYNTQFLYNMRNPLLLSVLLSQIEEEIKENDEKDITEENSVSFEMMFDILKRLKDDNLLEKMIEKYKNYGIVVIANMISLIDDDEIKMRITDRYEEKIMEYPDYFGIIISTLKKKKNYHIEFKKYENELSEQEKINIIIEQKDTKKIKEILLDKYKILDEYIPNEEMRNGILKDALLLFSALDIEEQKNFYTKLSIILEDEEIEKLIFFTKDKEIKKEFIKEKLNLSKLKLLVLTSKNSNYLN